MATEVNNLECTVTQHQPMRQVSGADQSHWHCQQERCGSYHSTAAEARWCEFKSILSRPQMGRSSIA